MDRFWGWRNWRQFTNIIISYQKQHFNIWSNILQLLDNHIIASFLLYAAYKNVFFYFILQFLQCILSFSSFSFLKGILHYLFLTNLRWIRCLTSTRDLLQDHRWYRCSEINITFVSTIFCTVRPLVQNLYLNCAYVCTLVCPCQRTQKYYNVSFRIWVIKVFISVKIRLKNKLFSEKIWWNGK